MLLCSPFQMFARILAGPLCYWNVDSGSFKSSRNLKTNFSYFAFTIPLFIFVGYHCISSIKVSLSHKFHATIKFLAIFLYEKRIWKPVKHLWRSSFLQKYQIDLDLFPIKLYNRYFSGIYIRIWGTAPEIGKSTEPIPVFWIIFRDWVLTLINPKLPKTRFSSGKKYKIIYFSKNHCYYNLSGSSWKQGSYIIRRKIKERKKKERKKRTNNKIYKEHCPHDNFVIWGTNSNIN